MEEKKQERKTKTQKEVKKETKNQKLSTETGFYIQARGFWDVNKY